MVTMLNRRLKIVFLLGVFTLLLYSILHLVENRSSEDYDHRIEVQVKTLLESNQHSALGYVDDPTSWQQLGEAPRDVLHTEARNSETTTHSRVVIQTHTRTDPGLTPAAATWPRSSETTRSPEEIKDDQIIFPSAVNCSRKQYILQIKNHKGGSNPTRDVYPCRVWNSPNPRDRYWPVVVPPTNGTVLKSISVRHPDPEIHDLISKQMRVQEERLAQLTETCLKHPELSIRQFINFVWDTSRTPPLVYCPIYKVASTTWMVYFMRLAHVNDDNTALDAYNKKSREKKKYMPRFGGGHRRVFQEYKAPTKSQEKNQVFQKSLRFIIVRHPFTRLLSAYRDKIETPNPKPFVPYFLDLQRAIILRYRLADSNVTSTIPTFSEFVDYVIDSTENLTTAKQWHEEVVCWTPYWVQCAVCASDYQVIIKLETMAAEEQFLAQVANLQEIQNIHEWRNLKRAQLSSAVVNSDYYETLTKRQILLLYERYKLDFDLFGYSLDEYLNLAKQG